MQQFQRGASPTVQPSAVIAPQPISTPPTSAGDTAIGARQRWLKATSDQGGAESAERQSTDQPPIRGDT
jgi:hypothetical protein